jgi:hypothetical protein
MRNISKNSFIEALEARKDDVYVIILQDVSSLDCICCEDLKMLYHRACYKSYTSRRNCSYSMCILMILWSFLKTADSRRLFRRSFDSIFFSFLSFLNVFFSQRKHISQFNSWLILESGTQESVIHVVCILQWVLT